MLPACEKPEPASFSAERSSVGTALTTFGRFLLCCLGPIRSGYDALRILLAVVLLAVAGLKAHQLATESVLGTGLLDSRWLLMATVEFELLFGLWLLAGLIPKPTWAVALACFGVFAFVSLYKALSGYATCGCFGRVQVNPWYTSTLDLGIVLSLLLWRPKRQGAPLAIHFKSSAELPLRAVGVLIIWLLLGVPAAFAMSCTPTALGEAGDIIDGGKVVVLKPETWIGKRFPLLEYIDIGDSLGEGEWQVLLYHHDCPMCQAVLAKYGQLGNTLEARGEPRRIALIEMPPYGGRQSQLVSPSGEHALGRMSSAKEWFAPTPLEVLLDGAVVKVVGDAREGMGP